MRMRKKRWGPEELRACPYFVESALEMRGRWRSLFAKDQPLHLEIGCGKGVSTARMIAENRDVNYIAADMISDMIARARRNIDEAMGGAPVDNCVIAAVNAMFADQFFAPEDGIGRIYISFCNPWTEKGRHAKRRLTHPRQLLQYRDFLAPGGEIHFKTDDQELFDFSVESFAECGYEIRYLTRDLHASGFAPNYESEHEIKFTGEGIPTKFLIAALPR